MRPIAGTRRDVERWSEQSDNWLAWATTPGHDAYWVYAPEFFDTLVPAAGRTVEVGCREGRVARDLTRRGHRVVAVDVAPTLLHHAASASTGEAYAIASGHALPFVPASFDVVVAYNSLMDVDDMPAALLEIARVLQPGGRLCICVTHPISDAGRFASPEPEAPFVIDGSYLAGGVFEETFERAGLEMTSADGCTASSRIHEPSKPLVWASKCCVNLHCRKTACIRPQTAAGFRCPCSSTCVRSSFDQVQGERRHAVHVGDRVRAALFSGVGSPPLVPLAR